MRLFHEKGYNATNRCDPGVEVRGEQVAHGRTAREELADGSGVKVDSELRSGTGGMLRQGDRETGRQGDRETGRQGDRE